MPVDAGLVRATSAPQSPKRRGVSLVSERRGACGMRSIPAKNVNHKLAHPVDGQIYGQVPNIVDA